MLYSWEDSRGFLRKGRSLFTSLTALVKGVCHAYAAIDCQRFSGLFLKFWIFKLKFLNPVLKRKFELFPFWKFGDCDIKFELTVECLVLSSYSLVTLLILLQMKLVVVQLPLPQLLSQLLIPLLKPVYLGLPSGPLLLNPHSHDFWYFEIEFIEFINFGLEEMLQLMYLLFVLVD